MAPMVRALTLLLAGLSLAGCSMVPDTGSQPGQRNAQQAMRPAQPAYAPRAETRLCHARLGQAEASYSPLPDQYYGAGCSTLDTVRLSALRSDYSSLSVANLGPVACPLAETFAAWARYGVDRAARSILGSPLARIETMGSYSCRDVAGTSRRSAHATANAIDIAGFVLEDGRRIEVKHGWNGGSTDEREFLRIVHQSACKRFGTVLGPSYNAAHHDHFHLESGDGSFCR